VDEKSAREFAATQAGSNVVSVLGALSDAELDEFGHRHLGNIGRHLHERRNSAPSLVARPDQSLIAIPEEENGEDVIRYFVDKEAARALVDERVAAGRPLSWIGAWCDLDADEVEEALDRIRHESPPTPPIDDL
jgi:hypothetical protein